MGELMERMIDRYGGPLTLLRKNKNVNFRGFLQPYMSRQEPDLKMSPMGQIPLGRFLFIGPGSIPVEQGEDIRQGNRVFTLRQAEPVYWNGNILYYWGMCVEKGVT